MFLTFSSFSILELLFYGFLSRSGCCTDEVLLVEGGELREDGAWVEAETEGPETLTSIGSGADTDDGDGDEALVRDSVGGGGGRGGVGIALGIPFSKSVYGYPLLLSSILQ